MVLKLDFSGMNTANMESLQKDFHYRVRASIKEVFSTYISLLGKESYKTFLEKSENMLISQMINELKSAAMESGQKIYTFIDEYDHFANKLASEGRETFVKDLVSRTGFVREFYEQMKIASGEGALERFYITGVSPIMLDELSSGFNIMSDMTTHLNFNEMLGFTEGEVKDVLDKVSDSCYTDKNKEEVFQDLVNYYNGYKFNSKATKTIFNSDMVLYFFQYFDDVGKYPDEILDLNVKTDYSKLRGLIVGSSGKEQLKEIIQELNIKNELTFRLVHRFTFENRLGPDELRSLLYFFGLLTMGNFPGQYVAPNYVIRVLHWEYLQKFLEESG
ncbi:MAG: AAA family ATPase [Leptospiraceae bacterium]|nr:AAA family ATPase [Leptospiraceae bacterium]